MRGWEFIYKSWFKTIFQWKETGSIVVGEGRMADLEYKPETKTLHIYADGDLNMKSVKALHSALGQVLREAGKD